MTLETALYGLFALFCGGLGLLLFGRRAINRKETPLPAPKAAHLEVIWKRSVWPIVASVAVLGLGSMTRGDTLAIYLEVSGGLFMVGAIFGVLYFMMFSVELGKLDKLPAPAPEPEPVAPQP